VPSPWERGRPARPGLLKEQTEGYSAPISSGV